MTVFVVTKNDRDEFNYKAAEKFGPVKFLFDDSFRVNGKRPISELMDHAKEVLKECFDAEPEVEHYLIFNRGSLLNNPFAAAVFAYLNGGYLSFLVYDAVDGKYRPIHAMTEDEDEDDELMEGELINE